jgi:hypothetical protein
MLARRSFAAQVALLSFAMAATAGGAQRDTDEEVVYRTLGRELWMRCEEGDDQSACEAVKQAYKRLCSSGDRYACACAKGNTLTCDLLKCVAGYTYNVAGHRDAVAGFSDGGCERRNQHYRDWCGLGYQASCACAKRGREICEVLSDRKQRATLK